MFFDVFCAEFLGIGRQSGTSVQYQETRMSKEAFLKLPILAVLVTNGRKTVAVSSAPPKSLASSFTAWRRASATFALLCCPLVAQTSVPEIPYDSVPDFLKLPADLYLGEVAGVAANSKGHVFVFARGSTTGPAYGAAAAQLLEFDSDGKYIREIGHHLYAWSFAHAVKVDKEDNIWVADKGSDMVIKFSPEGRVLMVFGRKQEASDEGTGPLRHPRPPLPPVDGEFRQVTDMTWDSAGNTYISDGYINSRVAKVDKNGHWVKSWGERGKEPGQFNTPHSIAADAQGNVYVADRG